MHIEIMEIHLFAYGEGRTHFIFYLISLISKSESYANGVRASICAVAFAVLVVSWTPCTASSKNVGTVIESPREG